MSGPPEPFSDPEAIARYAEGPPRHVPGYHAMQSMATILIAERVAEDARVLVLGAGGGLELKAFAQAHPGWRFDGVDPSDEMLKLAERTLGPLASRAHLLRGYIEDAPEGPFDAAASLLTLHFLPAAERQRTVAEVHRRLRPGAPFVVAHYSVPSGEAERALWMSRQEAFLVASGIEPGKAALGRVAVETRVSILSPEQDEAILRSAGFSDVALFYAGFTFRGWVAYA